MPKFLKRNNLIKCLHSMVRNSAILYRDSLSMKLTNSSSWVPPNLIDSLHNGSMVPWLLYTTRGLLTLTDVNRSFEPERKNPIIGQ